MNPVPPPAAIAEVPAPRQLSRGRRRLFIGLILLVAVTGQELLCRWLFPVPEVEGFNRIHYTPLDLFSEEVNQARQRGLSNIKVRWESAPDGFAFDHTLNLYGFRGPDFAVTPPTDRPRVLFIGDSFVEGCGADDGDTLPAQFARAGPPVEAINLGVNAANFPEYGELLRDSVHLLRPAAVFLIVCANDLPAPPLPAKLAKPPPDFSRVNPGVPRAAQVLRRSWVGLAVPLRRAGGPYPFVAPVPSATNPLTSQLPPADLDPDILDAMRRGKANPWNAGKGSLYERLLRFDFSKGGGVAAYLRRMDTLCHDHGARLIVVYVPYLSATNAAYIAQQNRLGGPALDAGRPFDDDAHRSQQRHLRQGAAELGVAFLDATDAFIEREKARQRLFWPIDGHCNAAGYGLLAEVCARHWCTGDLPPGTGSVAAR